ncbi:transglycosylase family protein [Jatrophihabitans sp. YIM 134969]
MRPRRRRSDAALAAPTLAVVGAVAGSLLTAVVAAPPATAGAVLGDRLAAGASMGVGDALRSANGVFSLQLQSDGNLVEYAGGRPVWTSSTGGRGGSRLTLQTDGNLVLRNAANAAVWSTSQFASDPSALILRNDAALYTARTNGSEYWGAHPRFDVVGTGAALRPGQSVYSKDLQYRLSLQTDGNLVLYSTTKAVVWTTSTRGTMQALTMQTDGNLVLRTTAGAVAFQTRTAGRSGAVLTAGTLAEATVAQGTTVAWRTPAKTGVVWRNQLLRSGQAITRGTASLTMQADGNLVRRDATNAAVWASGTRSPGAYAWMQSDGNLVIRSTAGAALWTSKTAGTTATFLQVSGAGFAYLGNAGRSPVWIEGAPNWAGLAQCESGGNPRAVNPAGYYGLYQFDLSTWASNGGTGNPVDATPAVQTAVAATLYLARGRAPWPVCGRYL